MFDSIFSSISNEVTAILIILAVSLVSGFLSTLIVSFKFHASKGFFITSVLLPFVVSLVIALTGLFLEGSTTTTARLITIGIALGLIRFRSTQGRAEEMLILLFATAAGFVCGLGYVTYGIIFHLVAALLYLGLSYLPLWNNKRFSKERLLKITIPESLDYSDVFKDTFEHYLKDSELVEVKTTAMGSLFRLSYRIRMKNSLEEKELIDELRTKNGNLEISILPYVEPKDL